VRRNAIVFALIPLLWASAASAAPFTPGMNFAFRISREHWGGFPNCTSIRREIVPDGSLGDHQGEATLAIEQGPCELEILREQARATEFEHMCALMIHEGGHLRGFDHSTDPRSIMFPEINFVPPVCMRAGERVLNHQFNFPPR
jgi:hypothetical protein